MIEIFDDNNLSDNFIEVNCPFCGSDEAVIFRTVSDIVKCLKCDTVYLRTRFASDIHLNIFKKNYTGDELFELDEQLNESKSVNNELIDELIALTETRGKLADVGCGMGSLILIAREKGFDVCGYEINVNKAQYLIDKYGLDLRNEDFVNSEIDNNSFNVVTLNNTLSYFDNILIFLEKAFTALKPGGIICGLTPNINSFASETLENDWEFLDADKQTIYFSPETIANFLNKAGFVIERLYTATGHFNIELLKNLISDSFDIYAAETIKSQIEKICNDGMGEEILFFARKLNRETALVDNSNLRIGNDNINQLNFVIEDNKEIVSESSKIFKIIEIELQAGDDFERIIYETYIHEKTPVKIVFYDNFKVLPQYAENWNGIEIRRYSKTQNSYLISHDEKYVSELIPENENKEKIMEENKLIRNDYSEPVLSEGLYNTNSIHYDITSNAGLANKPAQGLLPDPMPQLLYLNLGCGNDIRDNFVNIDLFSNDPNVVRMDVRSLDIPDETADLILANDILEHFSHHETDNVLREWARVLKPDGSLIIRCPSLKLQMKAYLSGEWNADIASYMIFGGQTNPGDFHCIGFDEDSIKKHLSNAGFEIVEFSEHDLAQDMGYINLNMTLRARKVESGILKIESEEKKVNNEPILNLESDTMFNNKSIPADRNIFEDFDFSGFDNENDLTVEDNQVTSDEIENILKYDDLNDELDDDFGVELDDDFGDVLDNDIIDDLDDDITDEDFDNEIVSEVIDNNISINSENFNPEINIIWEGTQFDYQSFALINREHCSNIISTGLADLTIIPYGEEVFLPDGNMKYEELLNHDIRLKPPPKENTANLPYVWIRHQWPPKDEDPKGSKWIIMQPWEFSLLWKEIAGIFKKADEIWTPSNFSRKCIVDSGIDFNKVQVIPNGIDPELFKPDGKKYKLPTKKKFKFLFVGGTIFRKGIDILLESYTSVFKAEDDVTLVIKDMGSESFYKDMNAKQKIDQLKSNKNFPEIIYLDDTLPEEQMAQLYRSCDVLVSPYRGEGFSLPALEAMACGLPVVVTQGGATDDFCDEEVAWLIPAEPFSIGTEIDGKELTGEAFLLKPSIENLTETLRGIYDNPSEVFSSGVKASLRARTKWTWKRATLKIFSRLDVLYNKNLALQAQEILSDRENSSVIMGEAEKEFERSNFTGSEELFIEALDFNGLSEKWRIHSLFRLAAIRILQSDMENAAEFLNAAEKLAPFHVDLKYLRAKIHAVNNEWVDSLEILTEIMNNWKYWKFETTQGLTLDTILCDTGECFYNMTDVENAIALYTQALKINDRNPYACYGAGKCFFSVDAKAEAKQMLEWAVKLKPGYEEAEELLLQLAG